MGGRLAAAAPLAASLIAHAAVVGGIAGAVLLRGDVPRDTGPVVRMARLTDGAGPGARLAIELSAGGTGVPAAAADAIPLDTDDPRYRTYLQAVRERIWRRWLAPELTPGRAARGTLVVEFHLTAGGALAEAAVRAGSGLPALDRAALEAVRSASPFAPPPPDPGGGGLRIAARFVYD